MWPWLLGSTAVGATLGGIKGYQESGGDLGATLRGAAGGGVVGGLGYGAQRMAGQALETALAGGFGSRVAPEAYKAAEALKGLKAGGFGGAKQAFTQAGLQSPLTQQMSGLNVLGKAAPVIAGAGGLAAGLAVPALAMPVIGGVANLTGQAGQGLVQTAARAAGLGVGQSRPSGAFDTTGAVPGQLPVGAAPANVAEVLDPGGRFAANRMAELKEADVQLENMKKIMPYLYQAGEARSKTEFQRQLAAAGVRQNIATAANMLERSQQAAQQMGVNAASQAGAALTSQYQYS